MQIQENISLKEYTTFRVGGCAKYFVVIKSIEDLKQAVIFAKQKTLPVFVLGGGSNLLVSDEGVNGLVIKMEIKGAYFCEDGPRNLEIVQIIASAGENWDDLVKQTVEKGLCGLENLSYIPGTVGASAIQNIGAYGVEVKDVIDWVEVFDIKTGEIKKVTSKACDFGYRDSIFKKPEGKNLIVIRVACNLQKNGKLKTDYKDIQDWIAENYGQRSFLEEEQSDGRGATSGSNFQQNLSLKELRNTIIEIRKNKLPDWKKVGTVGSFFKNPIITKEQLDKLLEKYPELPYFAQEQDSCTVYKIPLAYILDKILGLKGFKEGNVGLYEKQPLALVNFGDSTSVEIKNLAQKIQKEVKQKTDLDIDFEVVEW